MKKLKSLTCLSIILLVGACSGQPGGAFSSSLFDSSSDSSLEPASSSSLNTSSLESSSLVSSRLPSSSSNSSSSSSHQEEHIYYGGYYSSLVSWQNGEDLKNQLHTIIRNGYTPLSYSKSSNNYLTNINADHTKYDFEYLDMIYSQKDIFKSETNKGWQREHAWCASLMCGCQTGNAVRFKGRATDFHNLFAADAGGNQSRGNKNYGYARNGYNEYTDRTNDNGADGYKYDETIFEPANKDKGRLARAIFYMATMYTDEELDTANNITMKGLEIVEEPVSYVAGNDCAFKIGYLSTLLEWNTSYNVDYLEMQHNVAVYSSTDNLDKVAQGNRNPYVDYPELVDYVYGSKKNTPGTLKALRASAYYLDCEDNVVSHYAIKEAKREHDIGETLSQSDYKVVAVKKNYSYEEVTTGITNSLSGHTFANTDGESMTANISTPINSLSYNIALNPMGMCNSVVTLSSTGISPTIHNQDQDVSYDGYSFSLRYDTSIGDGTNFYIRNISAGGVTLGSSNSPLTGFVLKTKNTYSVDKIYIKACAGNTSSSYYLTIKVGDTIVWEDESVTYLSNGYLCFGGAISETLTGQVSFVFTGTNALKINSIAFNRIIA